MTVMKGAAKSGRAPCGLRSTGSLSFRDPPGVEKKNYGGRRSVFPRCSTSIWEGTGSRVVGLGPGYWKKTKKGTKRGEGLGGRTNFEYPAPSGENFCNPLLPPRGGKPFGGERVGEKKTWEKKEEEV